MYNGFFVVSSTFLICWNIIILQGQDMITLFLVFHMCTSTAVNQFLSEFKLFFLIFLTLFKCKH